MTVSFRIDQLNELEEWMKSKTEGAVKRGIASAAFRTLGIIVNELIPNEKLPPIFDGAYRAAWRVELTEKGADVVNSIPYASVIEWGAKEENIKIGRAMIETLTEWARRKLGAEKPESVAWAIAKSMQGFGERRPGFQSGIFNRDGKQGLRIGERAAARVKDFIKEEIQREMKREK